MTRALRTSAHECYGYRVVCEHEPEAHGVVEAFFGPPLTARQPPLPGAELRLTLAVVEAHAAPVEPPHNLEVMMGDPVVVDTGSSRAVLDPSSGVGRVELARDDLANQIVWGRWILERLFVYLVCRSPDHYPLHAGAIVVDGRAVVVAAPGAGGKSTLIFGAFLRGAGLAGEDILVRHLHDPAPRLWGYPRAFYVADEWLARAPELAGATATPIGDGEKRRVIVPAALDDRLHRGVRPEALVFVARHEDRAAVRPVPLDDAVERCREDFAIAKEGAALVAVEADLRALLEGITILELDVSSDLDETYGRLRRAVGPRREARVAT